MDLPLGVYRFNFRQKQSYISIYANGGSSSLTPRAVDVRFICYSTDAGERGAGGGGGGVVPDKRSAGPPSLSL